MCITFRRTITSFALGGKIYATGTLRADGPQKQVLENNMDLNSLQPLFAMMLGMSLVSFLYSEFLLKMLHKLVLDHLGVRSVAVVIGGSMGGMADLEWPLCSPPKFVHPVTPLTTSARHSAWRISRGKAQFAQTNKLLSGTLTPPASP